MTHDTQAAGDALRAARQELHLRPNVVATGVGYKVVGGERTEEVAVVCSVTEKVPRSQLAEEELVPREVSGVPTDVVATGRLRALETAAAEPDPRGRFRPAPGGVSIGHRDVSAGTLGCLVRRGGELLILSNNHVLANSNVASAGDPVLQPASHDGGTLGKDTVATLADFVPLRLSEEESGCGMAQSTAGALNWFAGLFGSDARLRAVSRQVSANLVDAALARPLDPGLVTGEILGIGEVAGQASAELGMRVRKSGRTTGLTDGEIVQIDVTADVWYGERFARFEDQLMADGMSRGGDSGSAVLDEEARLVGLLFGGSDDTTLVNRIEHVFDVLGVGL
jgi:hypothetical protein